MEQLNLEMNNCWSWCPDGAASYPLSHCLWDDQRRRSEYFDLLKMLGRDTRIYNIQSSSLDCVFGQAVVFPVVSRKMLPQKWHFPACLFASGKSELSEERREGRRREQELQRGQQRGAWSHVGDVHPWEQQQGRK